MIAESMANRWYLPPGRTGMHDAGSRAGRAHAWCLLRGNCESRSAVRFRSVGWKLATTLALVSLFSVLLASIPMWWWVRTTLDDSVRSRMEVLRTTRVRQVGGYLERVQSEVTLLSNSAAVASAMADLSAGYAELPTAPLAPNELAEIAAFYADIGSGTTAPNAEFDPASILPANGRSQHLQLHYLARAPDQGSRASISDPGDGSGYSRVHKEVHESLRRLSQRFGFDDLLLVDFATRAIVYSAEKRSDFGTSLKVGPYRRSGLAAAVDRALSRPDPTPTIEDFTAYLPADGMPTIFVAARIVTSGEVRGVVVVALGSAELSRLLTAGGEWELAGLGRTGETYLVGPDLTLRSESRRFIEQPTDYPDLLRERGVDPAVVAVVSQSGTTVLAQPTAAERVRAALDGRASTGMSENYLGTSALSSVAPLGDAHASSIGAGELHAASGEVDRGNRG